eukprot:4137483-Prymnesium_polylepis.1
MFAICVLLMCVAGHLSRTRASKSCSAVPPRSRRRTKARHFDTIVRTKRPLDSTSKTRGCVHEWLV